MPLMLITSALKSSGPRTVQLSYISVQYMHAFRHNAEWRVSSSSIQRSSFRHPFCIPLPYFFISLPIANPIYGNGFSPCLGFFISSSVLRAMLEAIKIFKTKDQAQRHGKKRFRTLQKAFGI